MNLSSLVIPPWVSIGLKALPWAGCIGLGIALALNIAAHRVERANWERDGARAEASAAKTEAANQARVATAADTYAQRTAALQPVILHSVDKVTTYAQTPAGRAPCLAADRVQSILADRADLFAVTAASSPGPVLTRTPVPDAAQQR